MKHKSKLPKLSVRKSGIHGKGVYAQEFIGKRQRIIEYTGQRISSKEGDLRSDIHPELTYIFTVNDKIDIDANVNGNEARFINHSCAPNSRTTVKNGRVWIISTREIKKGEEIAYDYNMDADDVIKCSCNSAKCRGSMNDPETLKSIKK